IVIAQQNTSFHECRRQLDGATIEVLDLRVFIHRGVGLSKTDQRSEMLRTQPECTRERVVSQRIVSFEKAVVSELVLDQCKVGREGGRSEDGIFLAVGGWIQSPTDKPVQRLVRLELDGLVDLVERCAINSGTEVVERVKGLETERECTAGRASRIDAALPG